MTFSNEFIIHIDHSQLLLTPTPVGPLPLPKYICVYIFFFKRFILFVDLCVCVYVPQRL